MGPIPQLKNKPEKRRPLERENSPTRQKSRFPHFFNYIVHLTYRVESQIPCGSTMRGESQAEVNQQWSRGGDLISGADSRQKSEELRIFAELIKL